jgi:xylulokinase
VTGEGCLEEGCLMEATYLAGIDIGTTGAKTAVFDLRGNAIASGYREYACIYPKANWVDQDAVLLVNSAMESAREAVHSASKSGVDPKRIAGIGVSAQRSCTIFVDGAGKPVRHMISWQDNRTSEELADIKSKVSPGEYYRATGTPLGTTWILTKILWLRKNEPEAWKKVRKVIQLHDFALKALGTDEYFEDIPDSAFFGFWDIDAFAWNERLMGLFDIRKDMLPRPLPSGTKVGTLSRTAAEKTGFAPGTPLCVGAGDQNSAVVGAGIVESGYLSVSMGTGGIAITYLDRPFRDPNGMSMVTNHAIHGKWQLEGLQNGAAGVFRWFRDEIATSEKRSAKELGKDPYEIINELIEKTPAGSRGLVFLPYLAASAAPRWNPHARGTFTGLTFAHDRGCLARAFIEGITMEMKDILNAMVSSGIEIGKVRIMGGATKSALWNQIQSDMYGRPVETLKVTDAALLGAAIFAGVGAGLFGDIREAVSKMVAVDKAYEPKRENASLYDELYGIYCGVYEGLEKNKVFERLAKVQERY